MAMFDRDEKGMQEKPREKMLRESEKNIVW